MPARIREVIEVKCPTCGRSGVANVAYGSERVTASAIRGFVVRIPAVPGSLQIACAACQTVVREFSAEDAAAKRLEPR